MSDEERSALFVARTHHHPIKVGDADTTQGSRIGGRAPEHVAKTPRRCPVCGGDLEYFLTMSAVDLGGAEEVSTFYCRSFRCLLGGAASSRLRAPAPLQAIAHPPSPRASVPTANDSRLEGRALELGALCLDLEDHGLPAQSSKVGGAAGLLQAGEGLEEALAASGLFFLFQFSELDYPRGMIIGDYRFAGGTLYVHAAFSEQGAPTPERAATFWQRT